jgi:hypothetical protein
MWITPSTEPDARHLQSGDTAIEMTWQSHFAKWLGMPNRNYDSANNCWIRSERPL